MKKSKKMIAIVVLFIIGVVSTFTLLVPREEQPKFRYELIKNDTNGKISFKHVLKNEGDKSYKIEFLNNVEVNFTITEIGGNIKNNNNLREIEKNINSKGRTVIIKPGEELVHDIIFPFEELPKGEYEIGVRISTVNIDTPYIIDYFKIE